MSRFRRRNRQYVPRFNPANADPVSTGCTVWRFSHPAEVFTKPHYPKYSCSGTWAGFASDLDHDQQRAEVTRELSEGWQKGSELIETAFGNVMARVPEICRRKVTRGHMFGFAPDVAALYQGRPDVYAQLERKTAPRTIRIVCDVSASAGVDASRLVWSGAVALALSMAIEASGNRSEIWISNYGYGDVENRVSCDLVCVKESSASVLPDMLASVLASPRYYRTGIVNLDCHHSQSGGGMTPASLDLARLQEIAPDFEHAVIVNRVFNVSDAANLLQTKLEEIEGE